MEDLIEEISVILTVGEDPRHVLLYLFVYEVLPLTLYLFLLKCHHGLTLVFFLFFVRWVLNVDRRYFILVWKGHFPFLSSWHANVGPGALFSLCHIRVLDVVDALVLVTLTWLVRVNRLE